MGIRPFNLNRAMQLLNEAGYNGEAINLLVPLEDVILVNKAWFIQYMLTEAGINVEVNLVSQTYF